MRPVRLCTLVLGLMVCTAFTLAQQQGNLTVSVHNEGKPVSRARVAFLIGGHRLDLPPTDNTGNSAGSVKVADVADEYVEVWVEQCSGEAPEVYLLARGAKLGRERPDCPRHKAGFFVMRGDGPWQMTTDVALLTVTTAGPVPALPPSNPGDEVTEEHHVWFEAAGGAGLNLLPNANDSCAAVIAVEPDAQCTITNTTFSWLANGSVNFRIIGAEGGFFRANPSQLTSSGTVAGIPSTLVSTFQPRGFYAAAALRLPEIGRFSVVPKAGVTFWHADLGNTQTLNAGGTTTTSSTTTSVNGTSPFLGATVERMITHHIGIGGDYVYLRFRKDPAVHQDNHMAFGHVIVRFGRSAPP